jgi:hypothetical protein
MQISSIIITVGKMLDREYLSCNYFFANCMSTFSKLVIEKYLFDGGPREILGGSFFVRLSFGRQENCFTLMLDDLTILSALRFEVGAAFYLRSDNFLFEFHEKYLLRYREACGVL